jgi:hypothetical protein
MMARNNGSAMPGDDDALFGDVAGLIDGARQRVAAAVNGELVMLYWSVGKRMREEVFGGSGRRTGSRLSSDSPKGWPSVMGGVGAVEPAEDDAIRN